MSDLKAILLAGGEGTRLRPISAELPKPLARIMGKPIMAYGLELLARHGFTDVRATLRTLPQKIIDAFGDGASYGVRLSYSVENHPLGTAGAVRACGGHVAGGGAFAVLSGDAVTDFDLGEALRWHNGMAADATILLSRQPEPLEYGLVMTDDCGRVTRFVEKPAWDQVFTSLVNTGVYILSPRVLELVPENREFDFARDLFPEMLERGMALYATEARGYWCDVGGPEAYLRCCADLLEGKANLELPPRAEIIPSGVEVHPPVFIGLGCEIEPGAQLGPYAMLSAGTRVGRRARVERSVLDGARVGDLAVVDGAYVGARSQIREGAVLREGAIVGDDCLIGEHTELTGTARVWPHKTVAANARLTGAVKGPSAGFSAPLLESILSGAPSADLTPELCLRLGGAIVSVCGPEAALTWQGGNAAKAAALALESGMCAAGGDPVLTDALFCAISAYAASLYRFPVSVFVRQRGDALQLDLFDEDGLPLPREVKRKLESLASRGDVIPLDAQNWGHSRRLEGLSAQYAAAAAENAGQTSGAPPLPVHAPGGYAAAEMLRGVLRANGCDVRAAGGGLVSLFVAEDGLSFRAEDEDGQPVPHSRLLGVLLWLEAAYGADTLALPYAAPALLDDLAEGLNMRILRLGRDGKEAREVYAAQRFVRDGVFGAVRLASGMRRHSASLRDLLEWVPPIHETSRVVDVTEDRGTVMGRLAGSHGGAELVEGFRARVRGGWVHVAPLPGRAALRVTAEAASMEAAAELCDSFAGMMKKIDGQDKGAGV